MSNVPLLTSCQIIEHKEIIPKYFLMKLDSPEIAGSVIPGQFFHIKVADRLDILLRRPISVFNYDTTSISILYEVVGKGTSVLSEKKPGEELNVLGPLGNGFTPAEKLPADIENIIVVGGGMGVIPLYPLAKNLIKEKKNGRKIDIKVFIGAQNQYKILCEKDFRDLELEPKISTDDGSHGYKGYITNLFKKQCAKYDAKKTYVYACGPNPMLKELSAILKENSIKGEVSMDRHMGCGMGVCLGCVVKATDGKYVRVCKDGPVFRADEILWE